MKEGLLATATEACAKCGRTDARLILTSRGPLCPSCREALVAAHRESAAADEAPAQWRALRVTDLTGAQLVTAVAWGVVKGFGIWALIGAIVALVIAIIGHILAAPFGQLAVRHHGVQLFLQLP